MGHVQDTYNVSKELVRHTSRVLGQQRCQIKFLSPCAI